MTTLSPDPTCLSDLLLVEPQFVLRRTIAAVAKDLGIARFHEATDAGSAGQKLAAAPFDGIVIDTDSGVPAFELLSRLRQGAFASPSDMAIIAITSKAVDDEDDAQLLSFGHAFILRKPFKLAELFQLVQRMTSGSASRYR